MGKKLYPFQNTSLINLRGEKWKDIPDFEGIYQVSNFGRVKTLSRELPMPTPGGGMYRVKERIRKAAFHKFLNETLNTPLYILTIALCKERMVYSFAIARLVYCMFKKKFDLADKTIWITYKDGDGRNIHVSNLFASDRQTVRQSSFDRGRAVSHLTVLSKPVTQFDATGNPINFFPSSYAAGKALGINSRSILEVATGEGHMLHGFFWRFGKTTKKLNLSKITGIKLRDTFNASLQKRLKFKNIDRDSPPAFLNLSIDSMKGELWKDVPGFEQLYKISNYGRLKALGRITDGQKRWKPEHIQRATIYFKVNSKGNKVPGKAFFRMTKDQKKHSIPVAPLVCLLFMNMPGYKFKIIFKDGNPLNSHCGNLVLES
jgi:hypothetical protein